MSDLFFAASKTLPDFLFPLSIAFLIVILVAAFGGAGRRGRQALAAAALLLWLAGSDFVAEPLVRSLERRVLPERELGSAEAIVVLGGGAGPALPPRTTVELGDEGDRLLHAARLWRDGRAPVVVVCGGRSNPSLTREPEASAMAEMLRFLGVPAEAILEERASRNTWENAVEAHRLLEPRAMRRILLVTSAMHMPRAAGMFRHVGFEVLPAPTDFRSVDRQGSTFDEGVVRGIVGVLLPSADSLAQTTHVLREYLGLAVYAMLGRLG
jgi:uncharacterized SAM-binding protein YcdF (DUF218 family)